MSNNINTGTTNIPIPDSPIARAHKVIHDNPKLLKTE